MAFEPRGTARPAGSLIASARAQNIPPRVVVARARGGGAPLQRSFLRVDRLAGDVVLSAVTKAEDRASLIVRLFNPGDEPAEARLVVDWPIARAFAVDFLEERQEELVVTANALTIRLRPRQIGTIEVTG